MVQQRSEKAVEAAGTKSQAWSGEFLKHAPGNKLK